MILAAAAAVIAGLVLLSAYAVQLRGQEASIDAMRYRASKMNTLSIVEVVERDVKNIGAHMYWNGSQYVGTPQALLDWPPVQQHFLQPPDPTSPWYDPSIANWFDSTAVDGGYRVWFQFVSQTDSLQPPSRIRYEWEPIEGETVSLQDGTERPLYEVRRYVDDVLTTSSRLMTLFRITPVFEGGMINLYDIRQVRVTIRSISPLGKADTIEESRFDAVYRPVGLTMENLN